MGTDLLKPLVGKVQKRVREESRPFHIGMIVSAGDFYMLDSLVEPVNEGWLRPIFYGDAEVTAAALRKAGLNIRNCILADAVDRETRIIAMMEAVMGGGLSALCIGPDAATRNFDLLRKARSDFFTGDDPGCGIAVIAVPEFTRLIFIADIMMRAEPTVDQRVSIVNNTIDVAQCCGVKVPKVAMLAAVEVVNPGMPVTVEAQQVADRVNRDDAVVEGPVSMDLAVSMLAVEKKKVSGDVPGRADCLIGSNLTVSRSVYQAIVSLGGSRAGVVLIGGKVPVALPGRTDGSDGLYFSILLAAVVASS